MRISMKVGKISPLLLLGLMNCCVAYARPNSGPHSHYISQCGILNKTRTLYVLENDVSASGTCFSVQADYISLDLNGHNILYGAGSSSILAFGVLGVSCWDQSFGSPNNPCGGSFNSFSVYGGSITQGSGAAPFSHCIRLGQGPGQGLKVHDITFSVHAPSSIPVYTTYEGTNAEAHDNKFLNAVTLITNRHQLEGQSIKFADSSHVSAPASIYGNYIDGGAQGGIFSSVIGTTIHDNVIRQNGSYTNDFAIYAWANGGDVYHNDITPIAGRGINIAMSEGERVHDNKIVVIEKRVNQEYGGCQSGGTYGIQFDDNPTRARAFQNTVVAKADECDAQALRVTNVRKGSENISHDNQYTAQRARSSATTFATGFGTGGAIEFISLRDTFVGDTSNVRFDWDGGSKLIFRDCVFIKGSNPAPDYATFSFRNGEKFPINDIHFVDSTFKNGAKKDSTDMRPILSAGDWPGFSEYFVDWTLKLHLRDVDFQPVAGAIIDISDALGRPIFQGTSDEAGDLATVVTEFRIYNTPTSVQKEQHSPYRINIRNSRCQPRQDDLVIAVSEPTVQTVAMNCAFNQDNPRQ